MCICLLVPGLLDMYTALYRRKKGHEKTAMQLLPTYIEDVLWVQPIKLIQVVTTSEFYEH